MNKDQLKFKENLEKLVLTKPVSLIAEDFGVSKQAVYKWLKKYDIKPLEKRLSYHIDRLNQLNEIAEEILKK